MAAPNTCNYKPIAGIHFPIGQKTQGYLSPIEKKYNLCKGGNPVYKNKPPANFNVQKWKEIIELGKANEKFITPQFSICFLKEFLDISITAEREVAVHMKRNGNYLLEYGLRGKTGNHDRQQVATILHAHPRSKLNHLHATAHSYLDIMQAVWFSVSNSRPIVSTVIGRICGGSFQISTMAVEGSTIYTTNSFERKIIADFIARMDVKSEQLLKSYGKFPLKVTKDPTKVVELAAKYKLSGAHEKAFLEWLKRKHATLKPLPE